MEHKGFFWRLEILWVTSCSSTCRLLQSHTHTHTNSETSFIWNVKSTSQTREENLGCFQRRCFRETAGKVWGGKNMWPLTTKEMIYTGVQSKPSESVLACDFGVVATVRIADQETTSPKFFFGCKLLIKIWFLTVINCFHVMHVYGEPVGRQPEQLLQHPTINSHWANGNYFIKFY